MRPAGFCLAFSVSEWGRKAVTSSLLQHSSGSCLSKKTFGDRKSMAETARGGTRKRQERVKANLLRAGQGAGSPNHTSASSI